MELDEMADLNTSVQAAAPGKIDSHSILFYGRCYSGMEKEETETTLKKSSENAVIKVKFIIVIENFC